MPPAAGNPEKGHQGSGEGNSPERSKCARPIIILAWHLYTNSHSHLHMFRYIFIFTQRDSPKRYRSLGWVSLLTLAPRLFGAIALSIADVDEGRGELPSLA